MLAKCNCINEISAGLSQLFLYPTGGCITFIGFLTNEPPELLPKYLQLGFWNTCIGGHTGMLLLPNLYQSPSLSCIEQHLDTAVIIVCPALVMITVVDAYICL